MRFLKFISIFYFFLTFLFLYLKGSWNVVTSDGRGYYVYLPSFIIDHDLDFSNQILNHWDEDFDEKLLKEKTPTGHLHNRYPIGLSLSIAPAFLITHTIATIFPSIFTPDGYSFIYQFFCLILIQFYGYWTMRLIFIFLTEKIKIDLQTALYSIALYWLGSNYSYYYFREPFMVHVVSNFWVTLSILKTLEKERKTNEFLIGFSFAMALVCRPTNIFILMPFIQHFLNYKKALGAAVPLILQLLSWKIIYGSYLVNAYEYDHLSFHWTKPKLIETLFSSRHGLFFWSPVFLLSFWGIFEYYKKHSTLILKLLIGFLCLWYVNSSWEIWWFGDAFGGRAFIEASLFLILGLSLFLQNKRKNIILVFFILYNWILMFLYITHKISRSNYLTYFSF